MFYTKTSGDAHRPSVLAIGGIDPSGGAGLLVDAAALRAVGAHPAVVAAVHTIQSGAGFQGAVPAAAEFVERAAQAVFAAQDVRVIKVGALGDAAVAEAVLRLAARRSDVPLVVDPVLFSTTGGALVDEAGAAVIKERLLGLASVVTPNLAEAAALSGCEIDGVDGMIRAGRRLVELGCGAALVKGGHLPGDELVDVLVRRGEGAPAVFRASRLPGGEVRGTGCALASLIAGHLALGRGVVESVSSAREQLRSAIASSYAIGRGGPRVLSFQSS